MKEHAVNDYWNFIQGYYISEELCDELIDLHKNNEEQVPGTIRYGDTITVNKDAKDSIDTRYDVSDSRIRPYINELIKVTEKYIESYPYCNEYAPFGITEPINIQQYLPGGAFHKIHTERGWASPPFSARHLVFLTYLNTVTNDGETEFIHQQLKIKPEKGLTLIWPTDWTFTHRGLPSEEEKFVITGWMNFLK